MLTQPITEDVVPLDQFKAHISQILKGIHTSNRPVTITQNGKPAVVVLSAREFNRMNQARGILLDTSELPRTGWAQAAAELGREEDQDLWEGLAPVLKSDDADWQW